MNTLMLVALAVVALCYCGGRFCPSVLKQNKEVVLGVLVGMALCSFAGLKLEGFDLDLRNPDHSMKFQVACCDDAGPIDKRECNALGATSLPGQEPRTPEDDEKLRNALCMSRGDVRSCSDGAFRVTPDRPRINQNPGGSCSGDFQCCGDLTCVDGRCAGGETMDMDSEKCCEFKRFIDQSPILNWDANKPRDCPLDINCDGQ